MLGWVRGGGGGGGINLKKLEGPEMCDVPLDYLKNSWWFSRLKADISW